MIQPYGNRVLVLPDPVEEVTSGGIILSDGAKAKYSRGTVVAVGPGKVVDNREFVKTEVKVGDRVVFPEGSGMTFDPEWVNSTRHETNLSHLLMQEDQILATEVDAEFPLKPLKDIVFVKPDTMPEKVGSFYIPENVREKYKDSTGTVVAAGKGCYVYKHKKWMPTVVKVGDRVLFDYQLSFSLEVANEKIMYMGEKDLQGIIRG